MCKFKLFNKNVSTEKAKERKQKENAEMNTI